MSQYLDSRIPERLWSKTVPCAMSGCWLWVGATMGHGYGHFTEKQKNVRAHRHFFEVLRSRIPSGLQLDHKCRVRCCVNPAHLEPVTAQENTRRGIAPAARHAAATHCVNGHAFDLKNTAPRQGRWRKCRACDRERQFIRRHGESR